MFSTPGRHGIRPFLAMSAKWLSWLAGRPMRRLIEATATVLLFLFFALVLMAL
jgi:hypothetical protein